MGSISNMLALRWHGNKDLRIDEVPVPKLRPGWVRVKNEWAGICGSGEEASERTTYRAVANGLQPDLHEYTVGPKNMPMQPHVLTGEMAPSIMGSS